MQQVEEARQGPPVATAPKEPPQPEERKIAEVEKMRGGGDKRRPAKAEGQRPTETRSCFYCKRPGHIISECRQKQYDSQRQRKGGGRVREAKEMECYWCGEVGHMVRDCPVKKADAAKKKMQQIIQSVGPDHFLDWTPFPQGQ